LTLNLGKYRDVDEATSSAFNMHDFFRP